MNMKQEHINEMCLDVYRKAFDEYHSGELNIKPLRKCRAEVYETAGYFLLRSYSALVAVVEKSTGNCYDILRVAYGYPATSAQHIAKFSADYGNGKRYAWREIPDR